MDYLDPRPAMDWYCEPKANEFWGKAVDSYALGPYTPCAIDSGVVSVSHFALLGVCSYRIWLILKDPKAQRFRLRSNRYNYALVALAGIGFIEPLLRLFLLGESIFHNNNAHDTGFAPFEVCFILLSHVCTRTFV